MPAIRLKRLFGLLSSLRWGGEWAAGQEQAALRLAESEAMLNQAQAVARLGSWHYDPVSGLFHCSQQIYRMFGLSAEATLNMDLFLSRVVSEDRVRFLDAWQRGLSGQAYEVDYRIEVNDRILWMHEKGRATLDEQGKLYQVLGTIQDITEKKHYEEHIERLAYHDPLTDLPNRAFLHQRLQTLLQQVGGDDRGYLLLLNIDRFKMVNHARGSRFGDRLLKRVAQRLQAIQLPFHECRAARINGDEFALLLSGAPVQQPELEDETRLQSVLPQVFQQPFELDGELFNLSASAGVARFAQAEADDAERVLQRAGMALAQARRYGGEQLVFFAAPMSEQAQRHYQLEKSLHQAIRHHELSLFLQPQFDAQAQLKGAEVLLRWQHPELGLVSPAEFIPIAESTGLIVDISIWVMEEAMKLITRARSRGLALHLAVNISPRHFSKHYFVSWLLDLLQAWQVDPSSLTLEITEGLFMDNLEDAVVKMRQLSALGIRFSIDDFGTGYSSLAYLKRLPIHELKIDKSFVQDAPHDAEDAALIDTILAVAESLRLQVVAEGVETPAQAEFLRRRGGIVFQGYLFGRPQAADLWLEQWLTESSHP